MTAGAFADIRERLRQFFLSNANVSHWYIGFSGGLDSSLLLSLAADLLPCNKLTAVHVNHGLHEDAHLWQVHCQRVAECLNVPFVAHQVVLKGRSEAEARDARYRVFTQLMGYQEGLLLAHHQHDQAETYLMRLMRGAGVVGLSGMPVSRPIGQGMIYRPLLKVSYQQMQKAAEEIDLRWIQDPSNDKTDFTRNWVRHALIPLLTTQWANVLHRLAESADRMAETSELLSDLAAIDSQQVAEGSRLKFEPLLELSIPRRKNVIYFWLRQQGISIPDQSRLNRLACISNTSKGEWFFGAFKVRAFDGSLYLMSAIDQPPSQPEERSLIEGVIPFSGGQLSIQSSEVGLAKGLRVKIRTRQPGDRIMIQHRGGHVTLKKWMNEQRVPPWLRDHWPIITVGSHIIAIPGLWLDPNYLSEGGLSLNWQV